MYFLTPVRLFKANVLVHMRCLGKYDPGLGRGLFCPLICLDYTNFHKAAHLAGS